MEELKLILKMFSKYNIKTIRFVVMKQSLDEHIEFIEKANYIYHNLTGSKFKLMLDVPCPKDKIRFEFTNDTEIISVTKNEIIHITNQNDFKAPSNSKCFYVNDSFNNKLPETAIIGDGDLLLQINEITKKYMTAICMNDADIRKGKAIASPCGFLKSTDEKITIKTLEIIKRLHPEICVLSYIENGSDVISFKQRIKDYTNHSPYLMSKIECKKAVENIQNIIDCSDSIMIARGCLAVNIGIEQLTKAQDDVVSICNERNIDVCIASNILRSLGNNNWPTRADICDLSHMIQNGINYFVITDGFCMNNRFENFIYFLKNTYSLYHKEFN